MVMDEPNENVNNIMSGIENTGGVLHNRKKLRQRFDIIKKLGQGTYGKVQLGINKETGQEVAIKTIKKCKIESSADLVRIRREVQIMSSVRHPNIIHIYEVFENREKMVLVMEYAAGGELYDYLSSRKVLPEEEARRIFRQIATAIYYCHKHKICHRDLKLENILLDEHGSAKIADFGLSNVFAEQRTLSTYCGSPLYASPEIVTGTPYNGPEVDCWSLGVLLYTMVYGAMPFDGTHFKTLVKQISLGDYFEPKKKSPASSLIKDMLTVSSKERADVERICSHWWVNEGYEHSCLDIAEELASQTPVRLDLLLSLNPQTVDSEKLVVTEEQVAAKEASEALDASAPVFTRSQSADSVMDVQMACPQDQEPAAPIEGDHTIKPSSTKIITPSVDIMEEARANPTKRKLEAMESNEKNKQPTKTRPGAARNENASNETAPTETGTKPKKDDKAVAEKRKTAKRKVAPQTETSKAEEKEQPPVEETKPEPMSVNSTESAKPETKDEITTKVKPRIVKKKIVPKPDETESIENDVNAENTSNNIQKPKERRKSRILEAAEKFNSPNNMSQTGSTKKLFIPGVSVGEHRQQFERRASLNSTTPPILERKGSLLIDSSAPPSPPEINGTARPHKKNQSEMHAYVAQSENVLNSIEKLMNHLNVENEDAANAPQEPADDANKPSHDETPAPAPKSPPAADGKALAISLSLEDARKSLEHSISLINEEKNISDKELHKKMTTNNEKPKDQALTKEQQMKHAVETISNAIPRMCIGGRKPPVPYGAFGRSSSMGPSIGTFEKLKIQSPVDKFGYAPETAGNGNEESESQASSPTSATLPRRKVSTAEIKLRRPEPKAADGAPGRPNFKTSPMTFRTEVEHKVGDLRSAPVRPAQDARMWGGVSQMRAASLEPEKQRAAGAGIRERIVPIQVQADVPRTPSYQRAASVKSSASSLSRQNTAESETESVGGSLTGAEPIRKSPREVIIPIAVEGGGYVTPRAASLEPSERSTVSSGSRTRRMNSLLADNSGDEGGSAASTAFGRLHRHSSIGRDSDGEDGRFHLHRLRSSRPSRGLLEPSDSVSSGEDDDDDGFEILTAENLFSTLLSRVRSLTQRLNVDDEGRTSFPRSSLLSGGPFGSRKPFWEHDPLSRRLNSGLGSASWRRSTSRDTDRSFGSPDWSSNNTLPRGSKSKKKYNQDSSKVPAVNNNDCLINDSSGLELDLADLDLSRLKLSQSELEALTSLTPNLSQRQQNQLLSQLPPTQARKLTRHLSLRLPKQNPQNAAGTEETPTLQQSNSNTGEVAESTKPKPKSNEPDNHTKVDSLRNSFRSTSEYSNDSNCKLSEAASYTLQNSARTTPDRSVLSKYLPLQKGYSLTDSTSESLKVRKQQPSQRRISRFLRPDFFDTPRDESCYAKQKRERELETQQVLREIRVKRDKSFDRSSQTSVRKDPVCASKDIYTKTINPPSLPTETIASPEKVTAVSSDLDKSDTLRQKIRKSSIGNSKIARPRSLIMSCMKTDPVANSNADTAATEKNIVKSKLPTSQNRRDSKLLRPNSYPNSAFSAENDIDVTAQKTQVDAESGAPVSDSQKNADKTVIDTKTNNANDEKDTIKISETKDDAVKKPQETSSGFLQSIGQTFDKLRGEGKTKTSKKSSKEQTSSSTTKSSTKQSALKLLKRKSSGNSERKNTPLNDSTKPENVPDQVPASDSENNEVKSPPDSEKIEITNNNTVGGVTETNSTCISNENSTDDQDVNSNKNSSTETKSERKSRIENVIRSLRERSIPRGPMAFTESGLIKRAVSVEDVTGHLKPSRRSVSKVLDLFNKIESNAETVRKKDDDNNANAKTKNKIKAKETCERPKSLIITNNADEKTGVSKNAGETVDHNKTNGQVINKASPDSNDDNSKSNYFINTRKPTSLKLDFSKVSNYRKSLEKSCNENSNNKIYDNTNSDMTHQTCENMNNHCKDFDHSDMSSATTCLSPNYEPELAFDDWSVCSDSIIHKNNMLGSTYSDVSPNFDTRSEMDHHLDHSRVGSRSYHNHSALENSDSESIVDRIKRKSYYLRFNEKKQRRKSSLVGPGAKDYYSSPVFDGKLDRLGSKPTSPMDTSLDVTASFSKYRQKKSIDLAKPITSDYTGSTGIKRRESCSSFDYRRSNSNSVYDRGYSTLDTRSPKSYGRSYLNYTDGKRTINSYLNGVYGDYTTGMHSSKDLLYNRDYHTSRDYTEPKSPYPRRSYLGSSYNGNYHTYNPSLPYSLDTRSDSQSTTSVPDHSADLEKSYASPSSSIKED